MASPGPMASERDLLPLTDTPDTTGIDYSRVYEPSEDTFLLLDALEADLAYLKESSPQVALEIGSGSGCVITFLAKIMYPQPIVCLSTDINPFANRATLNTASKNGVMVDAIQTSMVDGLRLESRAGGSVDILLFNPPYVPSEPSEYRHPICQDTFDSDKDLLGLISAAWAGGVDGRFWIDKLMPLVNRILSPSGCLIMILLEANRPHELMAMVKKQYGLDSKILLDRRAGLERLYAVRFSQSKSVINN